MEFLRYRECFPFNHQKMNNSNNRPIFYRGRNTGVEALPQERKKWFLFSGNH